METLFRTRIQRLSVPAQTRLIAISDVHAHGDLLKELLAKVDFGPEDVLVIVGDILERGAQSLATLRYVMSLAEQGNVFPLIGNVDAWILQMVFARDVQDRSAQLHYMRGHYNASLVSNMCEELGVPEDDETDYEALRPCFAETFAKELAFMRALPTILETEQTIFVHGGIAHTQVDAFAGELVWPYTKWDDFMDAPVFLDKRTVVGHTPVCNYAAPEGLSFVPKVAPEKNIVSIDGGCGVKAEGQLNAWMLQAGEVRVVSHDGLPEQVALDAQEPSRGDVQVIRYVDGDVRVLARAEDFVQVQHKRTGMTMWVPQQSLVRDGDDARCGDATDYHLPVAPGDILKPVLRTSRGTLCKRESVLGWYGGRLEGKKA